MLLYELVYNLDRSFYLKIQYANLLLGTMGKMGEHDFDGYPYPKLDPYHNAHLLKLNKEVHAIYHEFHIQIFNHFTKL